MPSLASPPRILLAEDNPADVGLVREALAEHAIAGELRVVADGEEVMRFIDRLDLDLETACPHLLLLDLHLPKYGGEEILKRLRASERYGRIPVAIVTSSDAPLHQQQAGRNTDVRYFRKPLTLGQFMELGTLVKEILGANLI